eukprot:5141289-Amphidinium_carterae.1
MLQARWTSSVHLQDLSSGQDPKWRVLVGLSLANLPWTSFTLLLEPLNKGTTPRGQPREHNPLLRKQTFAPVLGIVFEFLAFLCSTV